jgi:hypothetical protein
MKLKGRLKSLFYAFFATLFVSGSTWWFLDKFVRVHTDLGEDHHPWQATIFRIHGFAAYFFIILFGYLIHSHVRPGLLNKQKKSFKSGMGMLVAVCLLILTSSTDLFAAEGSVRDFLISSHRYLGLGFPIFLAFHLGAKRLGRKEERFTHGSTPASL